MHPIDALDGLRIFARRRYRFSFPGARLNGGFFGVDTFFVLSGYLITGLLRDDFARTGTASIGIFYARRAIRLTPAPALMLTGVAPLPPPTYVP